MNKILVIEDNISDLKVVSSLLIRKGFDVYEATDAYMAIEKVTTQRFDLILLDWMLPRVSGIELLKTLRSIETTKTVPIVFVTSKSEAKDIKRAIDEGVSDYVIKPIDPMILENKISRVLKKDDKWLMSKIPENLGAGSQVKTKITVTGLSEVGIEFKSSHVLPILETLTLETPFLATMGIRELQVRIQECSTRGGEIVITGTLIGIKESELKSIRMFLKANALVGTYTGEEKSEKTA